MKKISLITLIVTFIIGAILGISFVVFDLWNSVTGKIFLTSVTVFGFSFPGLACSFGIEKSKNKIIPIIGLIISIISCLYILLLIWGIIDFDIFDGLMWKFMFSSITLSVSFGHLSLMSLINSSSKPVNCFKWSTIVLSLILDLFILLAIYEVLFIDEKLFIVICILVALGTVVTPLMYMSSGKPKTKYQEIEELKKLLDSGAITEKEYQTEKNKLLNK